MIEETLLVPKFKIVAGTPGIILSDTAQGADLKKWSMDLSGGDFRLRTLNDAESEVALPLVVTRAGYVGIGTTPTEVLDVNGNIALTGYVEFNRQVTTQANFLKVNATDTDCSPIEFAANEAGSGGGGNPNYLFLLGFNVSNSKPANPRWYLQFESNWLGSYPGHADEVWSEIHMNYYNTLGENHRPWGIIKSQTSEWTSVGYVADNIAYTNREGTLTFLDMYSSGQDPALIALYPSYTELEAGPYLLLGANTRILNLSQRDVGWLYQLSYELIRWGSYSDGSAVWINPNSDVVMTRIGNNLMAYSNTGNAIRAGLYPIGASNTYADSELFFGANYIKFDDYSGNTITQINTNTSEVYINGVVGINTAPTIEKLTVAGSIRVDYPGSGPTAVIFCSNQTLELRAGNGTSSGYDINIGYGSYNGANLNYWGGGEVLKFQVTSAGVGYFASACSATYFQPTSNYKSVEGYEGGTATTGGVSFANGLYISGSIPSGTVTSVGLSMPAIFSVADSPITTAGTIAVTLVSQASNIFLAGPTSGSGVPTFRGIAENDLPGHSHAWSNIVSGVPTTLSGYGITDASLSSSNGSGKYVALSSGGSPTYQLGQRTLTIGGVSIPILTIED